MLNSVQLSESVKSTHVFKWPPYQVIEHLGDILSNSMSLRVIHLCKAKKKEAAE